MDVLNELVYLKLTNIKKYIPENSVLIVDKIEDETIVFEASIEGMIFMIITLYDEEELGFSVNEGDVLRIEEEEIVKDAAFQKSRENDINKLFERLKKKNSK